MSKMTKVQYRKEKEDILELLNQVTAFKKDTLNKQNRRINKAKRDYEYFFKTYFPHYAEEREPESHKEWIQEIQRDKKIIPVAAPRGHAKSTKITFGYSMWLIIRGEEGILPIVSATKDLAADHTSRIYIELENNERLKSDFGDFDLKGGEHTFVVNDRIKIKAIGAGQKFRGLKYKQHRPNLFIIDDLEDDEQVASPARRQKLWKWFWSALYPALHPVKGRIFIIGTILHFDGFLQNIINQKDGKIYKAIKDNGTPLWEERFPLDKLEEMREDMGYEAFEQEMMNNPLDEELQDFKLADIQFYENIEEEIIGRYAYIDPALGKNKKSDYPALAVGLLGKSGTIYIEEAYMKKVKIEKTIENIFFLNGMFNFTLFGIEEIAFQEVLKKWLESISKQRYTYIPFVGYRPRDSKDNRIKSLVPLIKNGTIKFKGKKYVSSFKANSNGLQIMIQQFIHYPKGNDDAPDAVHGLVKIIKKKTLKPKTKNRENAGWWSKIAGRTATFY